MKAVFVFLPSYAPKLNVFWKFLLQCKKKNNVLFTLINLYALPLICARVLAGLTVCVGQTATAKLETELPLSCIHLCNAISLAFFVRVLTICIQLIDKSFINISCGSRAVFFQTIENLGRGNGWSLVLGRKS